VNNAKQKKNGLNVRPDYFLLFALYLCAYVICDLFERNLFTVNKKYIASYKEIREKTLIL